MNFIRRLMLVESKLTDQQDDIQSKGKSGQVERVGCRPAAWTTCIRAAISTVGYAYDLLERDDGSLRDGGTAAYTALTLQTVRQFPMIEPLDHLRIGFLGSHRYSSFLALLPMGFPILSRLTVLQYCVHGSKSPV